MADAQTLRTLCDRLAPNGDLRYRVPFEIVAEIGCDHHRLLASKLGKKASTNLGAIHCYVEIKNVHLMRRPGLAEFPDSVTTRGTKHLNALSEMASIGALAVMVYFIQRGDAERFSLAHNIDRSYANAFLEAASRGVEAIALSSVLTLEGLSGPRAIPLDTPVTG